MKKIKKCIVCNGKSFTHLFKTTDRMFDLPNYFNVIKCNKCGLLFINPLPTKKILKSHYPQQNYYSYKKEIKGLSGLISELRTYLIKHYYEPTIVSKTFSFFVKGVPAIPQKPKHKFPKMLDVGCGSGKTLELLKNLGWDAYGLEIDKRAVKIASDRGLKNVKLGDYTKIASYPDNFFDAIRLYHVFEHLPVPRKCLRLAHKKLKPGGELLIGTPNTNSVVSKIFAKNWYNLDVPRHLYIFSEKNLSQIVKNEGFNNISWDYYSSDGLGRSLMYTINYIFKTRFDTNKFTLLFFVLYPFEWILDKLKAGDIIALRGAKSN